MSDKTMTAEEAVSRLASGMTLGIGGWGSRRKPMALVRALLRSDVTDLTVVSYGGPDVGMLGYALGPRVGAVTYNLVHHRALAVAIYILGWLLTQPVVQAVGALLLFHASVDRALGFGLKYGDSFRHTHLGEIGRSDAE